MVDYFDQVMMGVVIFDVGFEVVVQVVDVCGQQCDLYFWRIGVVCVVSVFGDNGSFGCFFDGYCFYFL